MATSDTASALTFEAVAPEAAGDPALREQLHRMWVDVTDAGGAVGFVAPADPPLIAQRLDGLLARVADGRDALGVLRDGGGDREGRGDPGPVVGMGVLKAEDSVLRLHWRTVVRVMVRPELQGRGAGRALMTGLHELAGSLGCEQLLLTVRGGLGLEGFYQRLGYTEVGRHPGAIRVADGDDRDEIYLRATLPG